MTPKQGTECCLLTLRHLCYFKASSPTSPAAHMGSNGGGGSWEENAHDMLRMCGKWGPRRFHQECHGRGTRLSRSYLSIPDDMEITRNVQVEELPKQVQEYEIPGCHLGLIHGIITFCAL